jgi:L-fucose mutarotase/ribose pyranase (RbsD/FucU family)
LSPYLDDTDTKLTETEVDTYVGNNGYLTTEVDGSITNEIELPTQTGNSGKVLSTNGTSPTWVADDVLSEAEVDTYVSDNGYLTAEVDGSITNEIELPTQTGNSGKVLSTNGTSPSWVADDVLSEAEVDTYVSDNGYLTAEVDGSITNEIELPTQTGNTGKYLTTNGSSVSWATPSGGSSSSAVIKSSNYTIQAGENVIISNAASTITFTLPTAASAGSGAVLHFYGITNAFNISTSQSIYDENGVAQTTLTSKYIIILVSDGVNKWCQMK